MIGLARPDRGDPHVIAPLAKPGDGSAGGMRQPARGGGQLFERRPLRARDRIEQNSQLAARPRASRPGDCCWHSRRRAGLDARPAGVMIRRFRSPASTSGSAHVDVSSHPFVGVSAIKPRLSSAFRVRSSAAPLSLSVRGWTLRSARAAAAASRTAWVSESFRTFFPSTRGQRGMRSPALAEGPKARCTGRRRRATTASPVTTTDALQRAEVQRTREAEASIGDRRARTPVARGAATAPSTISPAGDTADRVGDHLQSGAARAPSAGPFSGGSLIARTMSSGRSGKGSGRPMRSIRIRSIGRRSWAQGS